MQDLIRKKTTLKVTSFLSQQEKELFKKTFHYLIPIFDNEYKSKKLDPEVEVDKEDLYDTVQTEIENASSQESSKDNQFSIRFTLKDDPIWKDGRAEATILGHKHKVTRIVSNAQNKHMSFRKEYF